MFTISHNPDVLTCLANLSNDEVFTPPHLANQMLDLLPQELFTSTETTFLDPFCKSGVFLREIVKRLNKGLETQIPDLQTRLNHIYTKQVFGIAITELTALMSRRTVYCAKTANGKFSVSTAFKDAAGNILFPTTAHNWDTNGRCTYCGANKENYERESSNEAYAYPFIHTPNPAQFFGENMRFDVIIGNPPYQLEDGGGTGSSAIPIYHKFIQKAKLLNPRFVSMIIPARWYSGGKGLDDFRKEMLNDKRIKVLVDFEDSRECFPEVDVAGGVCYFLWDREYNGHCSVIHNFNKHKTKIERGLNEYDVFIRNNISINIIHKIKSTTNIFFDKIVSSRMPFGLTSDVRPDSEGDLTIFTSGGNGPYKVDNVSKGIELISKWKVFISKASHDHGGQPDKFGQRQILSRIIVAPPNSICTETYLAIYLENDEVISNRIANYLKLKFVRFLIGTTLLTQNITQSKFAFVPLQDFKSDLTDELLYAKYGLTDEEIALIENTIKPMPLKEE